MGAATPYSLSYSHSLSYSQSHSESHLHLHSQLKLIFSHGHHMCDEGRRAGGGILGVITPHPPPQSIRLILTPHPPPYLTEWLIFASPKPIRLILSPHIGLSTDIPRFSRHVFFHFGLLTEVSFVGACVFRVRDCSARSLPLWERTCWRQPRKPHGVCFMYLWTINE